MNYLGRIKKKHLITWSFSFTPRNGGRLRKKFKGITFGSLGVGKAKMKATKSHFRGSFCEKIVIMNQLLLKHLQKTIFE